MSWKDMAEEVAQHLRDQYAELRAAGYSHQERHEDECFGDRST